MGIIFVVGSFGVACALVLVGGKSPVIHLGLGMYSTAHVNSLICLVIFNL